MDVNSQRKVINAGFKIIRCDDQPSPRIKVKDGQGSEWRTLEKDFPSKAARDRKFKALLLDENVIQD